MLLARLTGAGLGIESPEAHFPHEPLDPASGSRRTLDAEVQHTGVDFRRTAIADRARRAVSSMREQPPRQLCERAYATGARDGQQLTLTNHREFLA